MRNEPSVFHRTYDPVASFDDSTIRQARDAEATTNRLTAELKALRASLLNGAPLVAVDTEIVYPTSIHDSTTPRKRRLPLMGDAEAEHLLLAGRRMSHLRRIIRVPLSKALVDDAKKIVEGNYGLDEEPVVEKRVAEERIDEPVPVVVENETETKSSPRRKNRPRAPVTPRTLAPAPAKSPRSTKTPKQALTPKKSPSPVKARQSQNEGTSFSAALNELIEAAHTLDESVLSDTDEAESEVGRNDRSTEGLMDRFDRDGSIHTGREEETEEEYTTNAKATTSPLRQSVTLPRNVQSPLAFLADQATSLLPSPRIRRSPSASTSFLSPTNNPRPSRTGSPSTPARSDANDESTSTEKRPRSPYLRWEIAEDEALVNAILQNGQRWELVAQAVPSRTYHQCRQRWLRGLKCAYSSCAVRGNADLVPVAGDSLPDDLAHHRYVFPLLRKTTTDRMQQSRRETRDPEIRIRPRQEQRKGAASSGRSASSSHDQRSLFWSENGSAGCELRCCDLDGCSCICIFLLVVFLLVGLHWDTVGCVLGSL